MGKLTEAFRLFPKIVANREHEWGVIQNIMSGGVFQWFIASSTTCKLAFPDQVDSAL
jgi:hypothetical protein